MSAPSSLDRLIHLSVELDQAMETAKGADDERLMDIFVRSAGESQEFVREKGIFASIKRFFTRIFSPQKYDLVVNLTQLKTLLENISVDECEEVDNAEWNSIRAKYHDSIPEMLEIFAVRLEEIRQHAVDVLETRAKGAKQVEVRGRIDSLNAIHFPHLQRQKFLAVLDAKVQEHPQPLESYDQFVQEEWGRFFGEKAMDDEVTQDVDEKRSTLEQEYTDSITTNVLAYADSLLRAPPKREEYNSAMVAFDAFVTDECKRLLGNQPIPQQVEQAVFSKKMAFDALYKADFQTEVAKNYEKTAQKTTEVIDAMPLPRTEEEQRARLEELAMITQDLNDLRGASLTLQVKIATDPLLSEEEKSKLHALTRDAIEYCDRYIESINAAVIVINQPKPQAVQGSPIRNVTLAPNAQYAEGNITNVHHHYSSLTTATDALAAVRDAALHPSNQYTTAVVINAIGSYLFQGGGLGSLVADLGLIIVAPVITNLVVRPVTDRILDKAFGNESVISPIIKPVVANITGLLLMRYGVSYVRSGYMAYTAQTTHPAATPAVTEESVHLPNEKPEPAVQQATPPANVTIPLEQPQSPITGVVTPQEPLPPIPDVQPAIQQPPQPEPSWGWKDSAWKVIESAKRGIMRPANIPIPGVNQWVNPPPQAGAGEQIVPPIQVNPNPTQGVK